MCADPVCDSDQMAPPGEDEGGDPGPGWCLRRIWIEIGRWYSGYPMTVWPDLDLVPR